MFKQRIQAKTDGDVIEFKLRYSFDNEVTLVGDVYVNF